ncbi:AAA family ATPase [Paraburkholderia sediminicola]|uniref:AAA family ATPase n=1 Tax=Paraburkholderia sediminicola TaxID=458836 RepID=UPI0038B92C0F
MLEPLREEADFTLYRGRELGNPMPILALAVAAEQPSPQSLRRLEHEWSLATELDAAWAAQPLALTRHQGRAILILKHPGGEPLDRVIGQQKGHPLDLTRCLRIAVGLAAALGQAHRQGLIHKDVKPANALVDDAGHVWLTGFGIASQLPRERLPPVPPEIIAGTFAYMSPEQTGRMNRSVDLRSDLYSLGVTLYELLTGSLPFTASDPMEWVHCHTARKPLAPDQRFTDLPAPLSDIVMKLLAKTAEERYQTAVGLEQDLRDCARQWERQQRIEPFPLGRHDPPGRLLISEKLYGRAREIAALQNAFGRIVEHPATALILVSGYTGIGKSSVVNELHRALVPSRGLFASGKFDQYKRDIPYATLAQAFQRLIRPILGKSEAEFGMWRESLLDALGSHGGLIVDMVPELKPIVGEQEPLPDLPAADAQRRFQSLLRRLIGVFARPEHPLALFFDDLQWLDAATLDLLEDLLTQECVPHLLLIGAYRDNEVDAFHPLMRKLGSIKAAGVSSVEEIKLGALDAQHVSQLIADALHCETDDVTDLAQLVWQKTDGNPFFINQFLSALTDEGLIAFDPVQSRWSWDLKRIHEKGYTDNVADLMISRLVRLPAATQQALQQLACLGNIATTAMLAIVHDTTEQALHASFVEARRQELVDFLENSYRFVHDRVHEAAYALIPTERRAAMHLLIGRMLVAHTPPAKLDETIFEIVNQLNRASSLMTASPEREQLAGFNLLAGKRAQASSAYVSALKYLAAGAALLTEDSWQQPRELIFALELARAQCEFASGTIAQAEERLRNLSIRAVTTEERVAVACLQVDLYQAIDRNGEAVAVGLRVLRHLGVDIPEHPTHADARHAYDGIWIQLGTRAIEDLVDLPLASDPDALAALDLLIRVAVPGHHFESIHLLAVVVCTAVGLGLERGHSDASCIAYAQVGYLAGPVFGQFDAGYRFGRLGCDLVARPGLQRFQARTFEAFGFIVAWTQHVRKGREFLFRAFDLASQTGELSTAGYALGQINTNFLLAGDSLIEVQGQAERGLAFVRRVGLGTAVAWIRVHLGFIRSLRGLTSRLGSFDDAEFDESNFERDLAGNPAMAFPTFWYYIRKLQLRFLAGEYVDALQAASKAQPLLWNFAFSLEVVDYHFYVALCHAAVHDRASTEDRTYHCARLTGHLEKLDTWALHSPENFANRASLVAAELARIEGRQLDAERLYERAISSARAADLVHNEALANELAGRFYLARGFERIIANAFFREARDCYLRWGADAKVRQLEEGYPQIKADKVSFGTATILASVKQFDLATVVRVSETVSGEIEQEKLIDTLMRTAIEYAGAERGVLILPRANEYRIEAEATTSVDGLIVALRQANITGADLPASVFQFVLRTRESLLLHDAAADSSFSTDDYIRQHRTRSVLCLPIVKQAKLVGVLYLENNLAPFVFTSDRVAVLQLLASQAAISLANAALFTDLQRSEAFLAQGQRISHTGSFGWNSTSGEHYWSEEGYNILGYDRSVRPSMNLAMQRMHPDDRDAVRQAIDVAIREKKVFDSEHRFVMPDGRVKHVHATGQPVNIGNLEFVGAIRDITERKRAEGALRQALTDLARINRVTTMGELTASLAHEIIQPITGAIAYAHACLRWLDRDKPDLDEARAAVTRIVEDGHRAAQIIGRIRTQFEKGALSREVFGVSEIIRDTVGLLRGEAVRYNISVRTELAADLPPIVGDRVQLQQVAMNLIINSIDAMKDVDGIREMLIKSHRAENEQILVSVSDTGLGVPPQLAEQIFDPFFTTKPHGTGMGLRISRSIVESHGGRLWVANVAGRGATFQFTLPATAASRS